MSHVSDCEKGPARCENKEFMKFDTIVSLKHFTLTWLLLRYHKTMFYKDSVSLCSKVTGPTDI